jgi:hypothetical protein
MTAPANTTAADLVDACAAVGATYQASDDSNPWESSPYKWLRDLSSRKKGAAGEKIIEKWLSANGCILTAPGSSQADRRVNGHPIEIKLSTEWENGIYKFQQIRDQSYEHIILFGVRPQALNVWCVPKAVILEKATGQHTGSSAKETLWLSFLADECPTWLSAYGGDSAAGLAAILATMPKP